MKGATADPSVKTKREPNNNRTRIIGANHHFFLTLRNSQNSKKIVSFDILIFCNKFL